MKKFDMSKFKVRKVSIDEIDDRMLLINLYGTQALTLIIGLIWIFFQHRNPFVLFELPNAYEFLYWGLGLGAMVLVVDLLVSRFVPDEAGDDGGINERIFKNRPWWHVILLSFIVSVCEETLFRGGIQHSFGPYWTSILFAVIHVRYLKHWIPTGLVFSISYGLGWVYEYTGTLWAPIVAHFLIDAVMGFIIKYRKEA